MNLFELFVKIGADTSQAEKGMKNTQKNSETLTNKIKVMSAQFEAAQKNVDKLTKEFNESVNKAGATDKATQELAKKLADAEKEAGKFAKELDAVQREAEQSEKALDDCNEEIKDTGEKAEKSGKGLSNFASKLGKGLATAAKIGTAAVGAAAAGITALTTAAVNNYAEYEQLVGGVDTLFKSSSQKVQEYAANAYKTAGMSANEYMSTVTSFSASLLQSLGGDTEAAAEYADMAITDMSDNANKMGTSMESIQNAYQGFAKQNYTMLDNLKLGYGGTKTEMERLLRDAEKFAGYAEGAFDIESFADVSEAIHIIQEEMGITGTTALEAGRTISGSVGAMKSAWANLLTGLADGNADVGELVNNLVTTIVGDGTESNLGVLGNVMPAVKTALSGASKLVSELLPKIVQEIPAIINDNLPVLAEAAISIIQSLVDGISQNQDTLMATAFETIVFLANSLISMLPQIVKLGLDLIVSLANGIAESIPELIPTIIDVVLQIVDTLTNPDTLSSLVDASIAIMMGLADGLIEALPDLLEKAPEIVQNLVDAIIENVPKLLAASVGVILKFVEYLTNPENLNAIAETALELINSLIDGFGNFIESLIDVGEDIIEKIKEGISNAWEGLKTWFNGLWDSLFGNRKVDVTVNKSSTGSTNSNANGISYVPYDGYYSVLHKGERVLTAEENKAYNRGASGNTSGITIIQNIQAVPQTPVEFAAATEAYFEQARWAFA